MEPNLPQICDLRDGIAFLTQQVNPHSMQFDQNSPQVFIIKIYKPHIYEALGLAGGVWLCRRPLVTRPYPGDPGVCISPQLYVYFTRSLLETSFTRNNQQQLAFRAQVSATAARLRIRYTLSLRDRRRSKTSQQYNNTKESREL